MKSIVFLFETRKKNRNEPKFEFPAAQYILSKRNQSRAEEIPGAPPTDNLFGPFIHCASCESVSSSIDPSIPARAPKNGANPSPISRSALLPLAIFPSLDLAPQTLTPPPRTVHGVAAQAAPPHRGPNRGAATTAAGAASPRRDTSASSRPPSRPGRPRPSRPPHRLGPPAAGPAAGTTGSAAPYPSTRRGRRPHRRRSLRRRMSIWRLMAPAGTRRRWTCAGAPCPWWSWRRCCGGSAPAGLCPPRRSAAVGATARAGSGGPPRSSAYAPPGLASSARFSRGAPRSRALSSGWKGE
jgi:hypothetical protein